MKQNKDKKQKLKLEKIKCQDPISAIKKLKEIVENNKKKFVESIDLSVNLGIDAKQSDQAVKGHIVLPNGSGRSVKVLVFVATEEQKKIAIDAGASFAGLEELILKIEDGFYGFDSCIATPDVMQKISKVARKLGPRGLMPSPKNGTVTNDLEVAIKNAIKGRVDFKNDKSGIVHSIFGKASFSDESLLENFKAVVNAIKSSKSDSVKGKFIKSVYISSTMGPSIEITDIS